MVIADSVHFTYERNFFPSLTDKEFEVMVLFCQLMSVNKVAKFLGKSESVVLKHLNNCKKKLNVKGDYDLGFFSVLMYCSSKSNFHNWNVTTLY